MPIQAPHLSRRARTWLTAFLLAVGGAILYAPHLDTSPIYLAQDEVTIALSAHSIASTGRDLMGRPWPLYFQMSAGSWFHPLVVYSLAFMLKLVPLSEVSIRLPTVCVGIANIVLMYFVAKALFTREEPAILAAVLLALTPAHFLHSRFALEYIYPLPFISAWLLCLFAYLDSDDPRLLFASTGLLGLGFYSYIASVFVMPMYVIVTCVALLLRDKPIRTYGVAIAGFLVPLLLFFVPWLLRHPPAYGNTVGHYLLYDSSRLNPLQGVREFLSYPSVTERTSLYWEYVSPSFLFLDATAPFMYSTRLSGVFLLPLVVFLPVGLYHAFGSRDPKKTVLLLGFVTAPLAAVLVEERFSINRALELLPFGVLLAVVGVVYLWSAARFRFRRVLCLSASAAAIVTALGYAVWTIVAQGRISGSALPLVLVGAGLGIVGYVSERLAYRIVVVAVLLTVSVQFRQYYHDYFTDYRARASPAFRGNRRGGLEYIIERSRLESVPAIYLSSEIEGIEPYWKLYLVKHRREDLMSRTVIYGGPTPFEIKDVPSKSAILAKVGDPMTESLARAGELKLEALITEPGDHPSFAVFRR